MVTHMLRNGPALRLASPPEQCSRLTVCMRQLNFRAVTKHLEKVTCPQCLNSMELEVERVLIGVVTHLRFDRDAVCGALAGLSTTVASAVTCETCLKGMAAAQALVER